MILTPSLIIGLIVALYIISSIKILNEYERGVIFRLGKLLPQPKGPGLVLVFAPIDRMVRVSLRTIVLDVPPQDIITRDNVSVKVNAVVYFRVMEPRKAIVEVENYNYATSQFSQTTLRSVRRCAQLSVAGANSTSSARRSSSAGATVRRGSTCWNTTSQNSRPSIRKPTNRDSLARSDGAWPR